MRLRSAVRGNRFAIVLVPNTARMAVASLLRRYSGRSLGAIGAGLKTVHLIRLSDDPLELPSGCEGVEVEARNLGELRLQLGRAPLRDQLSRRAIGRLREMIENLRYGTAEQQYTELGE